MILLLVGTVGFLSSLWTGAVVAGAWTIAVLVIHAVIDTKCRQFLSEPPDTRDLRRWRLRFIILDLFYGLAWMYNLVHPVGQDEGSNTFMLFVMLLVVAVSSMLASSLPIAVFAATVPVTFAVALNFALQGTCTTTSSASWRSRRRAISRCSRTGFIPPVLQRWWPAPRRTR